VGQGYECVRVCVCVGVCVSVCGLRVVYVCVRVVCFCVRLMGVWCVCVLRVYVWCVCMCVRWSRTDGKKKPSFSKTMWFTMLRNEVFVFKMQVCVRICVLCACADNKQCV